MLPMSLRTAESEQAYQDAKKNGGTRKLADVPAKRQYNHWKIIPNDYGKDVAYEVSDMLLPMEVVSSWRYLSEDAIDELWFIIDQLEKSEEYHDLTWCFPHRQSVPGHFHIHLSRYYDSRDKMKL